jgi:hypothetical protein
VNCTFVAQSQARVEAFVMAKETELEVPLAGTLPLPLHPEQTYWVDPTVTGDPTEHGTYCPDTYKFMPAGGLGAAYGVTATVNVAAR